MYRRRHSVPVFVLWTLLVAATSAAAVPPPDQFRDYSEGQFQVDDFHHFDPNVTEYWFDAVVDHFNYRPTLEATFPLRFFVNDQYYANSSSPVIFYAGNEAPITQFVKNSGFLWEAAKALGAMVVFAEHRYYGKSYPLSGASGDHHNNHKIDYKSSLSPQNISYLTVEQAMADYNTLVLHIRRKWHMARDAAFIVTGGSYGGNLALWLRLKNPNLWAGALASSATPLKHLLRESNAFNKIVANVYGNVSAQCPELIRSGWKELQQKAPTVQGRAEIAKEMNLCSVPDATDAQRIVDTIHGYLSGALETMVQYGYPYPTEFYNPVPGYPFKVACENMLNESTGLGALRAAAQVYYNYTGQAGSCFDWFPSSSSSSSKRHDNNNNQPSSIVREQHAQYWNRMGQIHRVVSTPEGENDNGDPDYTGVAWGYQCCTEVYQPMPTNGKTDFEFPYTPNQQDYFENCRRRWDGVTPRPNWEEMTFWSDNIQAGSKIFLTSGQLDPWRAAGIQSVPRGADESIIVRIIEHGAHHLDLRSTHPLDPPSVTAVRREELQAMGQWIRQWRDRYPPLASSSTGAAGSASTVLLATDS